MNNNDNTPDHEIDFMTFRDLLTDHAVDKVLKTLWESGTLYIENDKIMIKETLCVEKPVETHAEPPECPICYDKTTDMIMCNGHPSVCKTCAPNLVESKQCPICRESIYDQMLDHIDWVWGGISPDRPLARRPPFQNDVIYDGREPYITFWNEIRQEWETPGRLQLTGISRCTYTFTMVVNGVLSQHIKIRKKKEWWVHLDRFAVQVLSHRTYGKIKIYLEDEE